MIPVPSVSAKNTHTGPDGEVSLPPVNLGQIIKRLRGDKGWTLARLSDVTGIARSSLSKIENSQMSPTYDLIQRLAQGLQVDIAEFFAPRHAKNSTGRFAVTRCHQGKHHETPIYDHEVLAATLTAKKMLPFKSRIKAHGKLEAADWASHAGEEFLYVLKGSVTFYTEHYEPVTLGEGDNIYIDSTMQHACLSAGDMDAEVLWISSE